MSTHAQQEALLTVPEVSRWLGVRKHAIYGFIKSGWLPAVRIGRRLRVSPADVHALLREARTDSQKSLGVTNG